MVSEKCPVEANPCGINPLSPPDRVVTGTDRSRGGTCCPRGGLSSGRCSGCTCSGLPGRCTCRAGRANTPRRPSRTPCGSDTPPPDKTSLCQLAATKKLKVSLLECAFWKKHTRMKQVQILGFFIFCVVPCATKSWSETCWPTTTPKFYPQMVDPFAVVCVILQKKIVRRPRL